MGYDTTLLVGIDHPNLVDDDIYFSIYATVDLADAGDIFTDLPRLSDGCGMRWYWHYGDNNKEAVEDCYGDKLRPVPIEDVIEVLDLTDKENPYRRLRWALGLLRAMRDNSNDTRFAVLIYGH